MTAARLALAALLATLATATAAQVPLELPRGARPTAEITEDPGAYRMPIGRFTPETQPALDLEGAVTLRAWQLPADRSATLAVMRALRPQLAARGFEILFECAGRACGGFDFRFNTRVLPPPAVEFDLTDFRYLAALRQDPPRTHLSLIVTRSPRGGYVQAIEVRPSDAAAGPLAPPEEASEDAALPLPVAEPVQDPAADAPVAADDLAAALAQAGSVVLEGVDFATGERSLGPAAIAALAPLAQALRTDPDLSVILVGHTDNDGPLKANIALSRDRARAVRAALIEDFDIAPGRLSAEGIGFLAPRASNATEEGQALNRRVVAVAR